MKCDKRKFDSESAAAAAMLQVPDKPSGQVPIRVYKCPLCNYWHYTSKTEMKRRQ